jgi:hypothetical protein
MKDCKSFRIKQHLAAAQVDVSEEKNVTPVAYRGVGGFERVCSISPRNSEVLAKLSRIPSSVGNTSVIT